MEPVHVSFFRHKLWLKASQGVSFLWVSLVYRNQGPCFQFLHLFCHALLSSPLATSILCVKVGVSLLSFQFDRFCASFYWIGCFAFVFCALSCGFCFTRNILGAVSISTPLVFMLGALMWPACHFYPSPESQGLLSVIQL